MAHAPLSKLILCRLPLSRPLHRYKGVLSLEEDAVLFEGKDTFGGERLRLRLCYSDIEELYMGYDRSFQRIKDRHLGLVLKPLRIRCKGKAGEAKFVYIFAGFNRLLRTSRNRQWMETIRRRI